jgi:hypothetical protein
VLELREQRRLRLNVEDYLKVPSWSRRREPASSVVDLGGEECRSGPPSSKAERGYFFFFFLRFFFTHLPFFSFLPFLHFFLAAGSGEVSFGINRIRGAH